MPKHQFPENLPVLPYDTPDDIPPDVYEGLKEQHEADQQQAREAEYEAGAQAQTEVYEAEREQTFSPPNRVQCPIEAYSDIFVTYDLTRQYFYRFAKPVFESSLKVEPKNKDSAKDKAEKPKEQPELWDDMDVLEKDFNRWMKRRAKWVRPFVKNIEGWSDAIKDSEGDPIPHPVFGGWQAYYDLFLSHPDLAEWIAEAGYESAMEGAIKNSVSLPKPTSETSG